MKFTYGDISSHVSKHHIKQLRMHTDIPPEDWIFRDQQNTSPRRLNIHETMDHFSIDGDGVVVSFYENTSIDNVVTSISIRKMVGKQDQVLIWDLRCVEVALFLRMLKSTPQDELLMDRHNMPPEHAVLITDGLHLLMETTKHPKIVELAIGDVFTGMTVERVCDKTLLGNHWVVDLAATQSPQY